MPPTRTVKQQPHADTPGPSSASAAAGAASTAAASNTGEGTKQQQQRACVACRRSKVRCVHDGEPPCRRCADTRQECKFRLRADDETWRERTDDTLTRLASAVDQLLQRPAPLPPPTGVVGQQPPVKHSPANVAAAGPPHLRSLSYGYAAPSAMLPPQHAPMPPYAAASQPMTSRHSHASPNYSDPMPDYHSPSASGGTNPTPDAAGASDTKEAAHRLHAAVTTPGGTAARSPAAAAMAASGSNSSSAMAAPSTSYFYVRRAPPLHNVEQTSASPALLHVTNSTAPIYLAAIPAPPKWTFGMAQDYARPGVIGRDDPRLNAISMGVVPMERARSLFVLFSERQQSHFFGFPTYEAAGQMTPLIITVILMLACWHVPGAREEYFGKLRNDCLETIKPDQHVEASDRLDPELGIGVEEIIAACMAAASLGGNVAWRIARIARWWSIGWIRQFESAERSVTLGECLTILPPFRQIPLVDRCRVWLSAYVAEAQQSFIADRPSIENCTPAPYIAALRSAFAEPKPPHLNGSAAAAPGGSMIARAPPMPDRQLIAHAGVLAILLAAQRTQRDGRTSSPAAKRGLGGAWATWMEELERWKLDAAMLEDLSANTTSAMDISLIYHLCRAHLGSLALEPEAGLPPAAAAAASLDAAFQIAQLQTVSTAKASALAALDLAASKTGFANRLVYLPSIYAFLLSHAAGFLLLLVQRKHKFLLTGEAKFILDVVEHFVKTFTLEVSSHNLGGASDETRHPSLATAEALVTSLRHCQAQCRPVP